jgi:DNA-directed RNA polymerase subunit E"
MAKEKACKHCKLIYVEPTCPSCGKKDISENFKGKVEITNAEKSEIGKELKVNKEGLYAIKL